MPAWRCWSRRRISTQNPSAPPPAAPPPMASTRPTQAPGTARRATRPARAGRGRSTSTATGGRAFPGVKPAWRPMAASDLEAVAAIEREIHNPLPAEGEDIFANRLDLFPAGCLVAGDPAGGYAIAHPWAG